MDYERGVNKLASGILRQYEPTFRKLQADIHELFTKQQHLIDCVESENIRLNAAVNNDLNGMFLSIKDYYYRLQKLKWEMIALTDRSSKLKKRALRLHRHKHQGALEQELQREAQLAREQNLIGKPKPF